MSNSDKFDEINRKRLVRNSIIKALDESLDDLPAKFTQAGMLQFEGEVSDDQLVDIARKVSNFGTQVTCAINFAKGGLWDEAASRRGGGMALMVAVYGEKEAEKQSVVWRAIAYVARKVPHRDRDFTRTWNYYRLRYNKTSDRYAPAVAMEGVQSTLVFDIPNRSGGSVAATYYVGDDNICINSNCDCGKVHNIRIPKGEAVANSGGVIIDPDTGEIVD